MATVEMPLHCYRFFFFFFPIRKVLCEHQCVGFDCFERIYLSIIWETRMNANKQGNGEE